MTTIGDTGDTGTARSWWTEHSELGVSVLLALTGLLVLGERFTGPMAVGAVLVTVGLMAVGSSARSTAASSDGNGGRPVGQAEVQSR